MLFIILSKNIEGVKPNEIFLCVNMYICSLKL